MGKQKGGLLGFARLQKRWTKMQASKVAKAKAAVVRAAKAVEKKQEGGRVRKRTGGRFRTRVAGRHQQKGGFFPLLALIPAAIAAAKAISLGAVGAAAGFGVKKGLEQIK